MIREDFYHINRLNNGVFGIAEGLRRSLATYPECAPIIEDLAAKQTCCNDAVQSEGGRDFCMNDFIYPKD